MLKYDFSENMGNVRMVIFICCIFIAGNSFAGGPVLDSTEKDFMRNTIFMSSAIVPAAFAFDEPLMGTINRRDDSFLNTFTHYANEMGNKHIVIPANAVLLGTGFLLPDNTLRRTSWNAFKSIGTTGITTELLKLSFGRARPHTDNGAYFFDPVHWHNNDYKSFPSGHTSLAFAFITPYAEQYSRWLYLLPVSVAFSRVYKNDHWPSDVLMGATLGFASGYFFQHKDRNIQLTLNGIIINF